MISAFGVNHGGEVSKADEERKKHYGRMAALTGGAGGTSAALGATTAAVGLSERRGKDPMGFTHPNSYRSKPLSTGARKKILGVASRAHGKQAAAAGAVGALGLGTAGAYKLRERKLSKAWSPERKKNAATTAAGVGASGAAVGVGGSSAHMLGSHARHHAHFLRQDSRDIAAHTSGAKKMPAAKLAHLKTQQAISRRVVGVKGAGALASAGVAAAGGAGLFEVGRRAAKNRKLQ